jgi:PleD family two-component response regulator
MSDQGRGSGQDADGASTQDAVGARALIVDDDPFISRLLAIELGAAGYEVVATASAREALDSVQLELPDIVLADVMMPNMDGFELVRLLREDPLTSSVPIIMLTARGLSEDKLEGFSAGADDYIVKPFDVPELLARMEGVMRRAKNTMARSPSTGLPGTAQVQAEVERRISRGERFALLAVDLEDLADYNDRYGFRRGDEVLAACATVLEEAAGWAGGSDAFIGHLGADDFVVVVAPGVAEQLARSVVERFDAAAPGFYDPEDRERGFIETKSRSGEVKRRPVLTITIGIVLSDRGPFGSFAEAQARATRTRQRVRGGASSAWVVDERRD